MKLKMSKYHPSKTVKFLLIKIKQRGQAMVVFALVIPTLMLLLGVGMDLGWYYLNVSRLQNAADAAALAGAQALVENDKAFEDYYIVALASNQLPAGFDNYENIFSTNLYGSPSKYKTEDKVKSTLLDGRKLAEEYTRKNLSNSEEVDSSDNTSSMNVTDGWSISSKDDDKKVSGSIELKFKEFDAKSNAYGPLYYVVNLKENIRHFFLPGWFDDMLAPVRAVVLLQPHDEGLITPIEQLKRQNVIGNWEEQNRDKGKTGAYAGNWNHYKAANNAVKYSTGNVYRTESVRVLTTSGGNSDGRKTQANKPGATKDSEGEFYNADLVDSINLDFRAEVRVKGALFTRDWDLGMEIENFDNYDQSNTNNYWTLNNGDDKRILYNVEFNESFKMRESFRTANPSKKADPLWVRIESEPIINQQRINNNKLENVTVYNSVRQITLNFNSDNTTIIKDDENTGHYEYRPYFIFYDGPENIDYAKDSDGVLIRHSKPVVINLNKDLNAIIYMPNSPVIINGNGHAWHGFIIAKCFLQPATSEDIKNGFTFYDGFKKKTHSGGYIEGTDAEGKKIYFKDNDLPDKSTIEEMYSNKKYTIDEATGNITVKQDAPKYILLNYTKADSLSEEYEVIENEKHNEAKTFANYINKTYKEKFKTFYELNDSEITAVTFPDENNNETTATYWVETSDLLDEDPDPNTAPKDDIYVKVKVGGADKYIDKRKLPYVKVRTNKDYFYVCVYDLKLKWGTDKNSPHYCADNSGVRMIDNSYTDKQINNSYGTVQAKGIKTADNEYKNVADNASYSDADIYINPNDKWCDSWGIEKNLLSVYKSNWKNGNLTFPEVTDEDEEKILAYFWLKTDLKLLPSDKKMVVAKYHKITLPYGDKYIEDSNNDAIQYYTQIDTNNDKDVANYIIVDKNGNIMTKPLTAPEIFTTKKITQTVNTELIANAQTDSPDTEDLYNYWNTYTRYQNGNPNDPSAEILEPPEMPDDAGKVSPDSGQYIMNSFKVSRLNKDYRIPVFERVYKAEDAFGLSKESYYSYFDIEDLKRVNYKYLNEDEISHEVKDPEDPPENWAIGDMFFTYTRAEWVD